MPPQDNDRPQLTGKQRAFRIPLDYYQKSDPIERAKNRLSAAAALLVLIAWLLIWVSPWPWGEKLYSRGDLAAAHAIWDRECSACHVNFQPISNDASWTRVLGADPKASDAMCTHCHGGPAHHAHQMLPLTPACAHCHRDHQGRDFDLMRTPDADCTGCHSNLAAAMERPGVASFAGSVTSFVSEHPDFRSLEGDPGRLKFDHKLHLSMGMKTDEKGDPQFKLEMIDPAYRERYQQFAKDSGLIQLECAACHQLDSGDFGTTDQQPAGVPSGVLPQRSAGAYFLPITYEHQCQACHPLHYESGAKALPHRLQPPQVRELLQARYTAQFLHGNLTSFQALVPLPGKDASTAALKEKADEFIHRHIAKAERALFTSKRGCAECHHLVPAQPPMNDWSEVRIEPTQVPEIWLKHARFDHAAHRALKCIDCHAEGMTSTSEQSILIPDRANCLQCHNTPPLLSAQGRARTDCVECHRYHSGDGHGLLQGIGARNRSPLTGMSVESFLRGGRSE